MSSSKGQHQVDFLKQVIAAGSTIAKASLSIERGLGRANPTYLLTLDQHGALTLQELPWTPEPRSMDQVVAVTGDLRRDRW